MHPRPSKFRRCPRSCPPNARSSDPPDDLSSRLDYARYEPNDWRVHSARDRSALLLQRTMLSAPASARFAPRTSHGSFARLDMLPQYYPKPQRFAHVPAWLPYPAHVRECPASLSPAPAAAPDDLEFALHFPVQRPAHYTQNSYGWCSPAVPPG
ncbi:hypothetical protein D1872_248720 [compost metagenome]